MPTLLHLPILSTGNSRIKKLRSFFPLSVIGILHNSVHAVNHSYYCFSWNSKTLSVLEHSVHIKAISLMAVILRLELWNIQETSRNFLVIENPCGQRVIAEHATYHPTWFMLHIRPFTNETFSLSQTQFLSKLTVSSTPFRVCAPFQSFQNNCGKY